MAAREGLEDPDRGLRRLDLLGVARGEAGDHLAQPFVLFPVGVGGPTLPGAAREGQGGAGVEAREGLFRLGNEGGRPRLFALRAHPLHEPLRPKRVGFLEGLQPGGAVADEDREPAAVRVQERAEAEGGFSPPARARKVRGQDEVGPAPGGVGAEPGK